MKKIIICLMALVALLCFSGTTLATGNIDGHEYNYVGTVFMSFKNGMSSTEVTTAMSSGGDLYATNSKAVALVSPAPICTVNRVRCYPQNYSSDLRINPNLRDNWVGWGQANHGKQVKAVQTILAELDLFWDEIDGECDEHTLLAIGYFQESCGIDDDWVVGPKTWRALCSARYFTYNESTWGVTMTGPPY